MFIVQFQQLLLYFMKHFMGCAKEYIAFFQKYCSHKMIKFLIQNIKPVKYTKDTKLSLSLLCQFSISIFEISGS